MKNKNKIKEKNKIKSTVNDLDMKPGWQKQEEKEKKKKMRRPMTEKEIAIARIVAEREEELNVEEDLIELRVTEEMVPKRFHKYLKMFEKKDSERMSIRKI